MRSLPSKREMHELNQVVIRELLDYDPKTGELFWKRRSREWFKGKGAARTCGMWNSRWAGKLAFTARNPLHRYVVGTLLGRVYPAHRIIWLWVTGEWPDEIDHID